MTFLPIAFDENEVFIIIGLILSFSLFFFTPQKVSFKYYHCYDAFGSSHCQAVRSFVVIARFEFLQFDGHR